MALSSTRTYTWQDLDDENPTGLGYLPWSNFTEWTGNGVTIDGSTGFDNLVHTTTEIDLGSDKDFYLQASAESVGTHSFIVQVDDSARAGFVDKDPTTDNLTGRYVKLKVTVVNATATAQLNSIDSRVMFETIQESFDGFSVGATATTLPITQNYSRLINMTYSIKHDVTNLQNFHIALSDTTKTAPKVISYDMDTWGNVASASTADITLTGFPVMTVTNGNISVG